jgi:hypothetical protein
MDLIGRFSNREIADRVDQLWERLSPGGLLHPAPRGVEPSSRALRRRRRKPGEVQAVLIEILRNASGPMRVFELRGIAAQQLKGGVARSSVQMALRRGLHAEPPLFTQMRRGLYGAHHDDPGQSRLHP